MQYGPVGMSAGQIKGSVTVPYTFQGEGSPLPRVAAARKAALVHTDEGSLWAKQPVAAGGIFGYLINLSHTLRLGTVRMVSDAFLRGNFDESLAKISRFIAGGLAIERSSLGLLPKARAA